METIDKFGRIHIINYRKLRITQLINLKNPGVLLVKAYFRVREGKANIVGVIPYQSITTGINGSTVGLLDKANAIIETLIVKLPVGTPFAQLSIFERNILTAICKTLVMANPVLPLRIDRPQSATAEQIIAHLENAGYIRAVDISKSTLLDELSIDETTLDEELSELEEANLITVSDGIVQAYPSLITNFYTISRYAARNGVDGEGKDDFDDFEDAASFDADADWDAADKPEAPAEPPADV